MADIDMADAAPAAPSKAKVLAKGAKAGGSADAGSDGKKRFEVKKVIYHDFDFSEWRPNKSAVERSSSLGMGHRGRQLRYLSKPHHGSLYPSLPDTLGYIG